MNHTELRKKYGDGVKNKYYEYPSHFFSPWDDFTTNIPNWEILLKHFKNFSNLNFLELGCASGRASYWLCDQILKGENSKLYCVDRFETQKYIPKKNWHIKLDEQVDISFNQNLRPMIDNNKCEFIKTSTENYLKNSKLKFDFIYIDASHEPTDVLDDAIGSFKKLKTYGIIMFDDYGWGNCRYGIDSFLHAYKEKYNLLYKDWQVAIQKL